MSSIDPGERLLVLPVPFLVHARLADVREHHTAVYGQPRVEGGIADVVLRQICTTEKPALCSFKISMNWSPDNLLLLIVLLPGEKSNPDRRRFRG